MPDKKTPNWPAKTGEKSGKGRDNNPPKEKVTPPTVKPNSPTKEPTKKK
jgi:hypothetical protein